ncbi:MAG: sialate O-acetylesterase, partial [Planctomycetota bacterium]|nr:sialate O-acetylesterase [Planctomycetota bacterium]
ESQSNWIRSYGTASVNAADVPVDAEWHVADGIGAYSSGCVGAWALRCANRLMDYLQMPIAVINGAVGGTIIASHLRDNLDPENLNTIYGRLLYRANKSGLASKARAIIWHQGESDGQGDPAIYLADWNIMRSAWAEDYPEANNVFIFQIRNGCGVSGDLDIRDLQRRMPDLYDDITAIPTTGIDEHDGCHFFYQGYKTMGTWAAAAIARVLYDAPFPSSGYPPRVASATFSSPAHDSIDLIFRDQSQALFLDQNIEGRFYLVGGGAETVSSATATLGKITLQLSGPTLATHISFLGNIGAGPWIKNQFGIGAFTFKLPILP